MGSRKSTPLLEVYRHRGVALLDGVRIPRLVPETRPWRVLVALAGADGAPVARDKLFEASTAMRVSDPKYAVRDTLRRLRQAFAAVGADGIVRSLPKGRLQLAARVTFVDDAA
jgi:DNA-binding winged helix-turn-helix (wHTH) protein